MVWKQFNGIICYSMGIFQSSCIEMHTIVSILNFRGLRGYKFLGEFILSRFCNNRSQGYYLQDLKHQQEEFQVRDQRMKGLLDTRMSRHERKLYSLSYSKDQTKWLQDLWMVPQQVINLTWHVSYVSHRLHRNSSSSSVWK